MSDPSRSLLQFLRVGTALVWLVYGAVFKLSGLVPRHQMIVGEMVGPSRAVTITIVIGIAEIAMAFWILSGVARRVCMVVQTIAIVAMNALELAFARELLLAPLPMIAFNIALLAAGCYHALHDPIRPQVR